MKLPRLTFLLTVLAYVPGFVRAGGPVAKPEAGPVAAGGPPPAVEEALMRARLLHASFDGTLRVMHRDFFRKGENKAIPSESLRDVFKTMAEEWGVTIRWLASEETVMNVDNKARDAFAERAIKAITAGEKEVTAVEDNSLRYAGVIVLRNECLKCHVADRKNLDNRFAALEIIMPVKAAPAPDKP